MGAGSRRMTVIPAAAAGDAAAEILMSTPSRFSAESLLSPWSGACVLQASNALFFLGRSLCTKETTHQQLICSLRAGILWGFCAAACYATLLPTLRLLGEIKQAGLLFPVGNSMTIMLFTAFTAIRFRERLTVAQWTAFAAVVTGIFLVKL